MSLDDTTFLSEELSPHRGKYLVQVSTNFSRLLAHFDNSVLQGYNGLDDSDSRQSSNIGLVNIRDFDDVPLENKIYTQLMSSFDDVKDDEIGRRNFLYSLRRTLLQYHMLMIESDAKVREGAHFVESIGSSPETMPEVGPILHEMPSRMKVVRIVSKIYKDVYSAMVEITKQGMGR